jgi:hypothetical protein
LKDYFIKALRRVKAHTNLTRLNELETTNASANTASAAIEQTNERVNSAAQIIHLAADTNQLKTISYAVNENDVEHFGEIRNEDESEFWSKAQMQSSNK